MGESVLTVGGERPGDPGTVVALVPNGERPRYRVVFEDGSEAELPPESLIGR